MHDRTQLGQPHHDAIAEILVKYNRDLETSLEGGTDNTQRTESDRLNKGSCFEV